LHVLGYVYVGHRTNNYAELEALNQGLKFWVSQLPSVTIPLEIIGDSLLVNHQLTGEWKIQHDKNKDLYKEICSSLNKIASFNMKHVYRKFNKAADFLANMAMDTKNSKILKEKEIQNWTKSEIIEKHHWNDSVNAVIKEDTAETTKTEQDFKENKPLKLTDPAIEYLLKIKHQRTLDSTKTSLLSAFKHK
jgi:ribonuclease HI